jgi:polysaccharide export outer membrane protein
VQNGAAQGAANGTSAAGVSADAATTEPEADNATTPDSEQAQPVVAKSRQLPRELSSIEKMISAALPPSESSLRQYGYEFLIREESALMPVSVGDDYQVGPGDALIANLWGDAVDIRELPSTVELSVDRNGSIFVPTVGQVVVWGLDLGTVRKQVKASLDKKYKRVELSLTLSKLREYPISVSGFVSKPGTVMATAVDTLFDVISRAGGIQRNGSLRNIRLTRRGVVEPIVVDLYDVLIDGVPSDLRVREGDAVLAPSVGPVAAVTGAARRPAIYELKGQTSVWQLISLAGGVLPSALSESASVVRFDGKQRVMINGSLRDPSFADMKLRDGDILELFTAKEYVANAVFVDGWVMFPGRYELSDSLDLKTLLDKATLLRDTNLKYGTVKRTSAGGIRKNFSFSLEKVMNGTQTIVLEAQDLIQLYRAGEVPPNFNFDDFPDTVIVSGPVKYPGLYAVDKALTLRNLVAGAELLLDSNRNYATLERTNAEGKMTQISFSPYDVLAGRYDVRLLPRDKVVFMQESLFEPIRVSGEVREAKVIKYYQGMTLIDLLRNVDLVGEARRLRARITPSISTRSDPDLEKLITASKAGAEQAKAGMSIHYLEDVLDKASSTPVPLNPGDVVVFERLLDDERSPLVVIRGEVLKPQALPWRDGIRLSSVITEAGGLKSSAYLRGAVVLRKSAAEAQKAQIERLTASINAARKSAQSDAATAALASKTGLSGAQAAALNVELVLASQEAELARLNELYTNVLGRVSIDVPADYTLFAGSAADIVLERDDQIFIPRTPSFVTVLGEAANQLTLSYENGMNVRDALTAAGWTSSDADLDSAYVVRASGRVESMAQRFFFKKTAFMGKHLNPGDTLYIPRKPLRISQALPTIKDIVQIVAQLTTTAVTTVALIGTL